MARIPDDEIERLKRETDLAGLVRASGVELAAHGAGGDLIGRCPLHDDKTPSLVVTPAKDGKPSLWHCLGACGIGGSAIDWIMKTRRVGFRHAVEVLREMIGAGAVGGAAPAPCSLPKRLSAPIAFDADDRALLLQVMDYYHRRLKQSGEALAYLNRRGIGGEEAINHFKIGFADRTLGLRLPDKQRKAGMEVRTRLEKIGLYRATGHEHLSGCVVFPVIDPASGQVTEVYGRKIGHQARGLPTHLYLPGEHRGVWNERALPACEEVILCESIIDALTFWNAGFRNVTCSYGKNGFTPDHLAAFKRHGTKRVLIAYDRDDAGEQGAQKLAPLLMAEGLECFRVEFPKGMDANEYALKVTPAGKSLELVVRKAVWLGNGQPPHRPEAVTMMAVVQDAAQEEAAKEESDARQPSAAATVPEPAEPCDVAIAAVDEASEEETTSTRGQGFALRPASPLAGTPASCVDLEPPASSPVTIDPPPLPPPLPSYLAAFPLAANPAPAFEPPASAVPPPAREAPPAEVKEQEIVITLADRRYRVRGLAKNLGFDAMKVNVMASRGEGQGGLHVDTLDLYSARARKQFALEAARELGMEESAMKHDLGRVLLKLEELQEKQIAEATQPKKKDVQLSDAERAAALALLQSPDLLERVLADFTRCGVVGEATNKLTGYLAAVSRKLEQPLAVVIQSSSAAGKSSLMEAVLAMLPPEEVTKFSAMTGQSLFYMQESDLKHKVLAIVEEEGAERASYALKLLQSEGELTIASTGKDPQTGRLVTQEYRVEGPVMIFLTTTAAEIDEELLNRCLVLSVNEERDPTDPRGMAVLRDKYLEHLLVKNYSPLTVNMRRIYLNYFIKWCEERSIKRPGDVTKPVIDRYQRWLFHYRNPDGQRGTGGALSFESQGARLQAVKAFFKWLTRENHILSNPASEIELPRVNKRLPRHILTASEADQVINQTNTADPPDPPDALGVRDRAILETLYSTGLRRTEMTKLSIYDVHLERATVMVRQGKWHKDRLVPIGQRALAWLNKYLAEVRPMLAPVGEEALFVTHAGEPFTPESMSQLARGYIERAQLPGGKQGACHIFRHTMATLMLEGGADIRYIQAILGHSHLSTTQVYTQVGIRMLQQVHAATHPTGLLQRPGGDGDADNTGRAKPSPAVDAHNHAYPPLPPSLAGADRASPSASDAQDGAPTVDDILIGDDDDSDDDADDG